MPRESLVAALIDGHDTRYLGGVGMTAYRENEHGHWVPAEPLTGTFGIRWEQMMRHRRSLGQGRLRALIGGWRDVRAVDRAAT